MGLFSTDAASDLGQTFVVLDPAAIDLPGAFAAMQREQAQTLIVQLNPLTFVNAKRITELAAQYGLPAMYDVRSLA